MISIQQPLFLWSVVASISFFVAIFFPRFDPLVHIVSANPVILEKKASGIPVNIKIPSIGVNAVLEQVGVTLAGEIEIPKGPVNAAWYNLGPQPGEVGSAIIDGHFGWKDGIPAVFDNLSKVTVGDLIYVLNDKGVTTVFVIREVRIYGENDSVPGVFISHDGLSHLNLITCGGTWNKITKSYSNRTVVFSDKVVGGV